MGKGGGGGGKFAYGQTDILHIIDRFRRQVALHTMYTYIYICMYIYVMQLRL